ncbi:MAG: hypothetical protein WC058_15470 [Phycisphaeraceae bacterium]
MLPLRIESEPLTRAQARHEKYLRRLPTRLSDAEIEILVDLLRSLHREDRAGSSVWRRSPTSPTVHKCPQDGQGENPGGLLTVE